MVPFNDIDLLNWKTPNPRKVYMSVISEYSVTRKKSIFYYAIYYVRLGRIIIGISQEIEYITDIIKEHFPKMMVILKDDYDEDLLTMTAVALTMPYMIMTLQDALNVYYLNRIEPHDPLKDIMTLYDLNTTNEEHLECALLCVAYALASSGKT
jgi:hypothetical protein